MTNKERQRKRRTLKTKKGFCSRCLHRAALPDTTRCLTCKAAFQPYRDRRKKV